MAIAIASTSNISVASSAGQTIPVPSGLTVGDLLIAHIALDINVTNSLNTPSGWTVIRTDDFSTNESVLLWKVATSTEVSNGLVYTTTAEAKNGGGLFRITGANTSNPISGSSQGTGNTSSFNLAIGLTPSYANSAYFIFVTGQTTATTSAQAIATSNPTWTEAYDSNNVSLNMSGAYATRSQTTATGNVSFTMSSSSNNQGQLLIVNPSVPSGGFFNFI